MRIEELCQEVLKDQPRICIAHRETFALRPESEFLNSNSSDSWQDSPTEFPPSSFPKEAPSKAREGLRSVFSKAFNPSPVFSSPVPSLESFQILAYGFAGSFKIRDLLPVFEGARCKSSPKHLSAELGKDRFQIARFQGLVFGTWKLKSAIV